MTAGVVTTTAGAVTGAARELNVAQSMTEVKDNLKKEAWERELLASKLVGTVRRSPVRGKGGTQILS